MHFYQRAPKELVIENVNTLWIFTHSKNSVNEYKQDLINCMKKILASAAMKIEDTFPG